MSGKLKNVQSIQIDEESVCFGRNTILNREKLASSSGTFFSSAKLSEADTGDSEDVQGWLRK